MNWILLIISIAVFILGLLLFSAHISQYYAEWSNHSEVTPYLMYGCVCFIISAIIMYQAINRNNNFKRNINGDTK